MQPHKPHLYIAILRLKVWLNFLFGYLQPLESQSGLYSAIRNRSNIQYLRFKSGREGLIRDCETKLSMQEHQQKLKGGWLMHEGAYLRDSMVIFIVLLMVSSTLIRVAF